MSNEQIGQKAESRFTGGAFANFFIGLITTLLSVVTLGLAYPAMTCWKLRWKAAHTYINGRQLRFDGKGIQLFGRFLLWLLLSVVTFGIYAIFAMPLNMKRWEAKHTHFVGVENGESKFDGTIWGLFGMNFITNFVTVITLTLGSYWAHCYRQRWYKKHEIIDGCRISFDGKGIQYFGKCFVWTLLTIVTLGIYSFWLVVNQEKWTVSHTHALRLPMQQSEENEEARIEKVELTEEELLAQKRDKSAKLQGILGIVFPCIAIPFIVVGNLVSLGYDIVVSTKIIGSVLCFCGFLLVFLGILFSFLSFKDNVKDRKGIAISGLIINLHILFIICFFTMMMMVLGYAF